jgi:hypothetical protein
MSDVGLRSRKLKINPKRNKNALDIKALKTFK